MDFVLSRPQLIRLLVNSPTNPAYRDVLKERDNAAYLGSSLDELARHHPPLKAVLHEALFDMLRTLATMGQKARWAGINKVADYRLLPDAAQSGASEPLPEAKAALEMPPAEEDTEMHMDVVLWLSSQVSDLRESRDPFLLVDHIVSNFPRPSAAHVGLVSQPPSRQGFPSSRGSRVGS
jgi:hypothetical protein